MTTLVVIEMKREEITVRIRRLKEIAEKTDEPNTHNVAQNQISVLEHMLNKWDTSKLNNTGEAYDEETDFDIAYTNAVEEIVEAEFG